MRVFLSCWMIGAALFPVAGCERNRATASPGGASARVVLEVRPPADNAELYIATQAELARGEEVLAAAAAALSLAEKWKVADDAAAVAKLAPMVTSGRVGDSALIELVVRAADGTESAEIANAVAKAFVSWAVDEEEERIEKRRDALQEKIEAQKAKLEESRKKMLDIMESYKITGLGDPAPAWLRGGAALELDAERQLQHLKTTISALDDVEGDQLIQAAVELGIPNQSLTTRYSEFQNLQLARAQLNSSGLGTKHPKVVAIDRQLTEMEKLLLDAVAMAKDALESQLAMTEQAIANRKALEAETAREAKEKKIDYLDAKQAYEREKQRLERLEEDEVDSPDKLPVEVR